jgi:serine/threonine-protein kinase PknK
MVVQITGFSGMIEIGRGGFATVYRARQDQLGRDVAIKVLARHGLADVDRRRFQREAQAMAELAWHPHIVVVFDAGVTHDGAPWLSMEHLPGGSLADALAARGRVRWEEAVDWTVQLAAALGVAHQAGILHRDVKPANALLSRAGDVKLADFGIAAFSDGTRTATGTVTATIAHAAPEVIAGSRASAASDVYSLGSTLFELLVGSPAFVHESDELAISVALRTINDPLPDLGDEVPAALATIVHRAMAKEPSARFDDPLQMASALVAVQTAHGLPATRVVRSTAAPPQPTDDGLSARAAGSDLLGTPPESETRPDHTVIQRPSTAATRTARTRRRVPLLIAAVGAAGAIAIAIAVVVEPLGGTDADDDVSDTATTAVDPADADGEIVTTTLEVDSSVPWNDSGIVLVGGEDVAITATGDFGDDQTRPDQRFTADGEARDPQDDRHAMDPHLQFPHAALLGRVGDGQPFLVGAEAALDDLGAGRLYLGVNDSHVQDNSGSFAVEVDVRAP